VSDRISGNGVSGRAAGITAFPHGLRALQSSQVHVFESLFGDFLVVPRFYYALLTAAFHAEGLRPMTGLTYWVGVTAAGVIGLTTIRRGVHTGLAITLLLWNIGLTFYDNAVLSGW
jgi:hypothetical protein